ncbi:AbrB/MazE/SpoVT family DNA-binding domain-containing protein [Rhizobium sp. AG855]|uniref:AbrB/MazE/SpoVT family DNA-binding domain-containing protein n=1 Tax=Rhizobium sp. AG855 TaxID=2183898 RepID=UPI000E76869D|nr:AbrB/MazE/SpoVT family DNA-binding domain-containing protein [Rhizobium sp. AG855]RKE83840.1 AbrB family looped-hinge helix DNA binding protein [Rhizobium sp. AG855]
MRVWDVTISAKGQITIPKELREQLTLSPGDQMVFSVVDGEIVITPKNIDLKDLAGFLGTPPNGRSTLEEIDETVVRTAGANALSANGNDPSDIAA